MYGEKASRFIRGLIAVMRVMCFCWFDCENMHVIVVFVSASVIQFDTLNARYASFHRQIYGAKFHHRNKSNDLISS